MTKEEKEAIEIVKQFNKENRYRDCGRTNNAIDKVIEMAEKQLNYMTSPKETLIEELAFKLERDIEKINEKLLSDEYINDYRIVRLKAIRMKCKEILDSIKTRQNGVKDKWWTSDGLKEVTHQPERGKGTKAYTIRRINMLEDKLKELKKDLQEGKYDFKK